MRLQIATTKPAHKHAMPNRPLPSQSWPRHSPFLTFSSRTHTHTCNHHQQGIAHFPDYAVVKIRVVPSSLSSFALAPPPLSAPGPSLCMSFTPFLAPMPSPLAAHPCCGCLQPEKGEESKRKRKREIKRKRKRERERERREERGERREKREERICNHIAWLGAAHSCL